MVQPYYALKGPELKALILKKCESLLDNSGKFDPHLTYPNCQFAINVQVRLPVTQDRNFELKAKVDEHPLPSNVEAETISLVESIVESEDNPPDKIRDDNNMPVSIPTISKSKYSGIVEVVEKQEIRGPSTDVNKEKVKSFLKKMDTKVKVTESASKNSIR